MHDNLLVISLPSQTRFLHALANLAGNAGELAGLDEATARSLAVAVVEAATNVIEHAYDGREDEVFLVEFALYPERLDVRVIHKGLPIDQGKIGAPDPDMASTRDKTRGYGLAMMRHLTDRVDFREMPDGRHACCLTKYRPEQ